MIVRHKNTSGVAQRWEFWLEWVAFTEGQAMDIYDLIYLWQHKQYPNWKTSEDYDHHQH